MDDKKPAVRGAEEVKEAEVRQAVEITMAGEAGDGRGDRRITFADVELAGRRDYRTAKRKIRTALGVLERSPDELRRRDGDAGRDASGVSAEALKLTRAEPAGNKLRRRQPYGSLNGSHSSSS